MRYIVCLLFTVLFISGAHSADRAAVRSELHKQLGTASGPDQKIELYRNLADLALEQPEERIYLRELIPLCKAAGNQEMLDEAVFDLAYAHIKINQPDSASLYMEMLGKGERTLPRLTFLRIKLFDQRMRNSDGKVLDDEIGFQQEQQAEKGSLCARIHQAYTTGNSLLLLSKHEEAFPFLEEAYELAQQLPAKEGRRLCELTQWTYANACNFVGERVRFKELMEDLIAQTRTSYEQYYNQTRPYYPVELYCLPYYASLMTCVDLLPAQTAEEYARMIGGMRDLESPFDKFNRDWALSQYYTHKKEYKMSLALLDSMTLYTRQTGNMTTLPKILTMKSRLRTALGDHRQALADFKESRRITDSLKSSEQDTQLNELKVQYEVDKLSYDNTQLQIERRRLLVVILVITLLAVMALCGYLYYNLRREQHIQQELDRLRAAAEESEQQKTAFINHICHEIRTPLNAIAGFSPLITDPTTDEESRQEFSGLITENSRLLTILIDHLLTVSELNTPDEKLPCETTDIAAICRKEFHKAQLQAKDTIVYKCEVPDGPMMVSTHEEYLHMVIDNLLNNAEKFTREGEITLSLSAEAASGLIRISVTDTGSGIPEADREKVFDRFVKLDRFTAGNGLGLYICRLIVTRLGGTISVDPEYSGGTRIIVELPSEGGGPIAPSI